VGGVKARAFDHHADGLMASSIASGHFRRWDIRFALSKPLSLSLSPLTSLL
jgi:hypothetical protein